MKHEPPYSLPSIRKRHTWLGPGGEMRSLNYVTGSAGWKLDGEGNFEGSNGTFRGDITGATGTFTGTLEVGGTTLTTVNTLNVNTTQTDVGLGNVENYSAVNQAVNGMPTAAVVLTSGLIRAGQTGYDSGTGFFLGFSGGVPKFSIGKSSGDKFTWNGTDLDIVGKTFEVTGTGASPGVLRLTNTDTTTSVPNNVGKIEFYNSDSGGAGINALINGYAWDAVGGTGLAFKVGSGGSVTQAFALRPGDGNNPTVPLFADFGGYTTVYVGWRLGIGTASPAHRLHVVGTGYFSGDLSVPLSNTQILGPASGAASAGNVSYSFSDDTDTGFFRWNMNTFSAATAGVARMTWAADGNVGIGTTSPVRPLTVDGTSYLVARLVGAAASTGAFIEFTGSTGTVIGYLGMPNNDDMHVQATGASSYLYFKSGGVYNLYINNSGYMLPYTDNTFRFGSSGARWNQGHFYDIYSHDGGVHTSDAALKTDIVDTPLGLDFVKSIRPVQYRWLEGTRSHQGFIAQEVETVLNDTDGVTASEQGMWCVEPVDTTRDVVEDGPDGAVRTTVEGEQFDRQSLRYNELMAPMVKALQELATRIEALEAAHA